ncbi:hypothetical protein EXS74_01670 [Candidatus Woesearchaeota archaeon]|nr:hypothetical protein [Candidatus Woesearchaeota archaeon]
MDLEQALRTADILARGSAGEVARLLFPRRKDCSEREYHVVDSGPRNPDPKHPSAMGNLLICYHCDAFFGAHDGFPYRVEKI